MRIWPIFCLLTKFCALSTDYGLYQAHDTHGNNATACGCFVMLLMDHTRWTWKGKTRARLVWFFYRTLVDVTNRHFSNDQRFLQLGGGGGKANGWCWQLSRTTSWKVRGGGGMKNCNSWISLARKSFTRRPERALKVEGITNIWNNFQKLSPAETFTRKSFHPQKLSPAGQKERWKSKVFQNFQLEKHVSL